MSLCEVDRKIQDTGLWMLLEEKAEAEKLPPDFMAGVGKICSEGIALAKDIIRFFPTFTLHDNVHICNVCDWMYKLLGGHAREITVADAALLVMAAACHDLGMSVSEAQRTKLLAAAKRGSTEWESYFSNHLDDYVEFQSTGELSDRILRSYVRLHHHERGGLLLPGGTDWPRALTAKGISRNMLLRLCKSHGEPLEALRLTPADQRSREYHLLPCAILLRLADSLDFDASRAPEGLYHHLGLDSPKDAEAAFSKMEWDKNCTNPHFELADGMVLFQAECASMQVEHQVRAYMDWFQRDLDECSRALSGREACWDKFQPPYKIEVEIQPEGYKSGPFCLTMEQDRILELLAGKNLYSDPGVFVRELLQNSIDAVQTRAAQDPSFQLEQGRISIRTWMDNDGCSWFRIEDNGTGMDQDIILNHFLKVGSSYYNSDRFQAESRRCGAKDRYTPISRFGIGILSCFMSDPEHNKLQLSTKRFPQAGSPAPAAIRMNVDGLHGYYYLAEEGLQSAESGLLTMGHPGDEDDGENGYRSEVGTTICVRLNLYQLGGFRTLKELVDRYVQFPQIRVEYSGQEGRFIYPTQQELMEEVHSLNPGGETQPPKEYCYTISDGDFEALKIAHPEIVWETDQKPGIVLKYCPLDWMTPGDQVSGVAVVAEVIRPNCRVFWPWPNEDSVTANFSLSYNAGLQQLELCIKSDFPSEAELRYERFDKDFSDDIDRKMTHVLLRDYPKYSGEQEWRNYFSGRFKVQPDTIPQLYQKAKEKRRKHAELTAYHKAKSVFPICFYYDKLSEDHPHVNALAGFFQKNGRLSVDSRTIVAFNGILADQSQLLGKSDGLIGVALLLQQMYRPEVNLSRDTISKLPLEAAAALAILQTNLGFIFGYGEIPEAFQPNQFLLKTEAELQSLLDHLPALKDELRLGPYTLSEAEKLPQNQKPLRILHIARNSLYDVLCLAAAKQMGSVSQSFPSYSRYTLYGTANDNTTASFPATLFFVPEGETALLGNINSFFTNSYNREHPFSQWLISHQRELLEKVPGIYNTLLEDMVMSTDKAELPAKLNDGLKRLQNMTGNPFHVTDDLFLKESDFI